MLWYNPVSGEGPRSEKPGAEIVDPVYWQGLYGDWIPVEDDFIPPADPAVTRSNALAMIEAATAAAIVGGFTSSATGAPYKYDSDENDQKNLTLMQTVSHSVRFVDHPIYQGRIPIRAIPEGATQKITLYLTTDQMDLLVEDLALHIGACKMAGWAAQAALNEGGDE